MIELYAIIVWNDVVFEIEALFQMQQKCEAVMRVLLNYGAQAATCTNETP